VKDYTILLYLRPKSKISPLASQGIFMIQKGLRKKFSIHIFPLSALLKKISTAVEALPEL